MHSASLEWDVCLASPMARIKVMRSEAQALLTPDEATWCETPCDYTRILHAEASCHPCIEADTASDAAYAGTNWNMQAAPVRMS